LNRVGTALKISDFRWSASNNNNRLDAIFMQLEKQNKERTPTSLTFVQIGYKTHTSIKLSCQ
jgi:hypothetical protein